jgi:secretion/DNA translocation related TadE-like protein
MRCRGDRGSATVWAGGIVTALCVVFAAVLAMSETVTARHRAAAGADLAALAAARRWPDGAAVACALADRVARAQRARLVRCEITGEVADVVVAAGHDPFAAESRARAGPPNPEPPPAGAPDASPSPAPGGGLRGRRVSGRTESGAARRAPRRHPRLSRGPSPVPP